jgi:hypothetical protein
LEYETPKEELEMLSSVHPRERESALQEKEGLGAYSKQLPSHHG